MTIADRILESTGAQYARLYTAAIHDLYVATVRGNRPAAFDARQQLAKVIAATMGAAELIGARMTIAAAFRVKQQHFNARGDRVCPACGYLSRAAFDRCTRWRCGAPMTFADEQTIIPKVTLQEALDDFVTRAPVTLKNAAERTAQRIAALYTEDRVVAFVRSAEEAVTREAQSFIARALREGIGEGDAGQRLSMAVGDVRARTEPWSEGYSRMVFRTNVNTAITAGRFRAAQDPDIKAAVPAFRFDSVGDVDTRHNHNAADGVILSVDSLEWRRIAPPLGYNCRCRVVHVSSIELDAMGKLRDDGSVIDDRVPADAGPDEGFRPGGRPDLFQVARA